MPGERGVEGVGAPQKELMGVRRFRGRSTNNNGLRKKRNARKNNKAVRGDPNRKGQIGRAYTPFADVILIFTRRDSGTLSSPIELCEALEGKPAVPEKQPTNLAKKSTQNERCPVLATLTQGKRLKRSRFERTEKSVYWGGLREIHLEG